MEASGEHAARHRDHRDDVVAVHLQPQRRVVRERVVLHRQVRDHPRDVHDLERLARRRRPQPPVARVVGERELPRRVEREADEHEEEEEAPDAVGGVDALRERRRLDQPLLRVVQLDLEQRVHHGVHDEPRRDDHAGREEHLVRHGVVVEERPAVGRQRDRTIVGRRGVGLPGEFEAHRGNAAAAPCCVAMGSRRTAQRPAMRCATQEENLSAKLSWRSGRRSLFTGSCRASLPLAPPRKATPISEPSECA